MIRQIFIGLSAFVLAFAILFTSVFRAASVRYAFKLSPTPPPENPFPEIVIDYSLPDPGSIQPDHPLWILEAIRDKAWLAANPNHLKKAEIALLLADKRVSAADDLSEDNSDLAVSVFTKAEMYLNDSCQYVIDAKEQGMETSHFMQQLALASLKHRAVLETFRAQAPQDAQPLINQILDHPKIVFEKTSHHLQEQGFIPPENPFDKI